MRNKLDERKLELLRSHPSALVTDAMRRLGIKEAWPADIHAISAEPCKMVGRAVTLKYVPVIKGTHPQAPGQFDIISNCEANDVLVYAALGVSAWLIGDNVANLAIQKKLAGLIVDGGARDIADLQRCALPIFCKSRSTKPYAEELVLEAVNEPCLVAGAWVRPGDIVLGDADGVVVIAADKLDDLLYQLIDLHEVESALGQAIAGGKDVATLNAFARLKGKRKL
ncbi:MAG: RraA family protein [Janthinobacterium lividum]